MIPAPAGPDLVSVAAVWVTCVFAERSTHWGSQGERRVAVTELPGRDTPIGTKTRPRETSDSPFYLKKQKNPTYPQPELDSQSALLPMEPGDGLWGSRVQILWAKRTVTPGFQDHPLCCWRWGWRSLAVGRLCGALAAGWGRVAGGQAHCIMTGESRPSDRRGRRDGVRGGVARFLTEQDPGTRGASLCSLQLVRSRAGNGTGQVRRGLP